MNRLQKKCLIATTGFHLLLVVILFVGPGFFVAKPKPDDTQVLDVIPANVVDTTLNSGNHAAQPAAPPPAPKPVTPTPPAPTPEPPKPEIKPEPVKPVEPVTPPEKLKPADLTPVEKPSPKPPKPHEIKVNLDKAVRKNPPKNVDTSAEDAAREAARAAKAKARAFAAAASAISKNATSATEVSMPGPGAEAYANYASVVKSIYEHAWISPDDTASDDANVKVSVTIARDGTVITSRILTSSGDAKVDASVQRTLDRVTFVREFPDGAKEKERTFIINFNLKAKRMLG